MNVPNFEPDRVRPGEAPELVSSRNFERLKPIVSGFNKAIAAQDGAISSILSKLAALAYPVLYGLYLRVGTNARFEDVVLVGGAKTVANTSVTANTRILYSRYLTGGTLGHLSYTISAGVGYTLTSTSGTETSTISCMLVERV